MSQRVGLWAPLGILLVMAALAVAVEHGGSIAADITLYIRRGGEALAGTLPYRDVPFEYPPLAIVPMALPRLLWPFGEPGPGLYTLLFSACSGILGAAVGWLLTRVSDRPAIAVKRWVLLVLVAAPAIAWRFDIWPATLVLGALVAAQWGRPGLAGVALAAGTMLKVFPAVVLPVLVLRALALGDRRGAVQLVGAFCIVTAVVFGSTLVIAGPDALQWLTYFRDRGLQFESTGSGLLLLAHLLTGHPASAAIAFGAIEIRSPGADLFVAAGPPLEAALVLAAWAAAGFRFRAEARHHGRVTIGSVAAAVVLALLALILVSKVFSVQYLVWFLPLLPLLPLPAFGLGLVGAALTTLIHPLAYRELIEFLPAMLIVLNLRNLLLAILLAWLVGWLVRERQPAFRPGREVARERREPRARSRPDPVRSTPGTSAGRIG